MKNNISGFAFLPILIGIGFLLVGSGAGVIVTKQINNNQNEILVENTINYEEATSVAEVTNDIELDTNEVQTEEEVLDEVKSQADSTPPMVETTILSVNQPHVVENIAVVQPAVSQSVVANTISSNVPTAPETPPVSNVRSQAELEKEKLLKLSYEKTKTESKNLTEGIEFVESRYNELLSFKDRGLELCKSRYEMNVSSARSQAESLKRSYSESRTGFATQPSMSSDIDRALQIDLARIEDEYTLCKSQYNVDSTVLRDVKNIKSEQSSIMRRLTLENAHSSLESILSLQKRLLTTADKLR